MKKKIILLTLISVFLLSAMIITSAVAQTRIVGVEPDDSFRYGDISVEWSSNDPTATFPPPGWEILEEMNETEWWLMSVVSISDTNITFQTLAHYKNGSEKTEIGYIDIDTGEGNMTFMAISADLNATDTIYTSAGYSDYKINETVVKTYPEEERDTNHLNRTLEWYDNETEYNHYLSINYYWDRSTGIIVEESVESIDYIGEEITTWSFSYRIIESNVWAVPEFPASTSLLLILIGLTVAIVIYKRKLPKH